MSAAILNPKDETMSQYNYRNVSVEIREGIAFARLNRPEKRNAMSPELHYEMDD